MSNIEPFTKVKYRIFSDLWSQSVFSTLGGGLFHSNPSAIVPCVPLLGINDEPFVNGSVDVRD